LSFLQPQVERSDAWWRLHRRRYRWLEFVTRIGRRQIPRSSHVPDRTSTDCRTGLPKLELIWLPHYRVSLQAAESSPEVDGSSRQARPSVEILVDGFDRRATPFLLTNVNWLSNIEQVPYEPNVTAQDAIALAHQALLDVGLLRSPWAQGVTTWETLHVDVIHYPFWVYYYRVRHRIDIRLLDALTGKPTGPGGKISLLSALASREATESSENSG
jgi:hypothetical protein